MSELLSGEFTGKIFEIGIPDISSNARLYYFNLLKDENKCKALDDLMRKYIVLDGKAVRLKKCTLTVDDIILMMLRLAGVSG